jgi:hypothetical protein
MTVMEASQVSKSIKELDATLEQVSKTYWETRKTVAAINDERRHIDKELNELFEDYQNERVSIEKRLEYLDKLERIEGRAACLTVLRASDGVRRTWQRMLEPGAAGSGIMPWVSNIGWWDVGGYRTTDMTFGSPILTPAFVEWHAPTEKDIRHYNLPYPFVVLTQLAFVGSVHSDMWELLWNNAEWCTPRDGDGDGDGDGVIGSELIALHGVAVPVWSVNPIEAELVDDWRNTAQKQWDAHWELTLIDSLSANGDNHWPVTDADGNEHPCNAYENYPSECDCGVAAGEQLLDENMEAGVYMPKIDGFIPTWERTVGRWTLGWFEIRRIHGNKAMDSFVTRLFPFYG